MKTNLFLLAGIVGLVFACEKENDSKPNIHANFTASDSIIKMTDAVNYTNLSTNIDLSDITLSFSWYFPGGTPDQSDLMSPSVTYSTPGTYSVKLIVSNKDGQDSIVKENYITVLESTNDGLVAYYPFTGNAVDSSGNGNNGTVHGAQLTTDRKGNSLSAYYFDGSLSYIDIGNAAAIKRYQSDFSVSGWIKINQYSYSYNSIILSNRNTATSSVSGTFIGIGGLQSSLSKRVEFIKNATPTSDVYSFEYISSNTQLALNTWYHFCVTYKYNGDSSNLVRLYINGNLESQRQMGETIDPEDVHTLLGCEPSLSQEEYSFNGSMDEIRIYNRVLNAIEVNYLYKNK